MPKPGGVSKQARQAFPKRDLFVCAERCETRMQELFWKQDLHVAVSQCPVPSALEQLLFGVSSEEQRSRL